MRLPLTLGPTLQDVEVLGPLFLGVLVVGTALMANRYRVSHGSWPNKKTLFLFIKILLLLEAVGGVAGWLIGKRS